MINILVSYIAAFFGDLSPFQIIVSIATILIAWYTLHKNFWEKAKVELYSGDAVRIVISTDQHPSQVNLMLNLVNKGTKMGIVHRIEMKVIDPSKQSMIFVWNLFYKYLDGGEHVQKVSDIYPISIPQKDNRLIFVQFQSESAKKMQWEIGKYELEISGWVNLSNGNEKSNLKAKIHMAIDNKQLVNIQTIQNEVTEGNPKYATIPLMEWERQHR